jgi:hypothetical protein
MRPLVYVAGPYTRPDPVLNVRRAIEVAESVERLGGTPFVPHLTMLWHLVSPAPVERWYERDLDVLGHCQGLVRFAGESSGADREVERARELGLPVYLYPSSTGGLSPFIAGLREAM